MYEDPHIEVSETSQFLNTAVYRASLTFNTVVLSDEMNYTCIASVSPQPMDSELVLLGSAASEGQYSLSVEGVC